MKILPSRLWWPVLVWCSLTSEILGARSTRCWVGVYGPGGPNCWGEFILGSGILGRVRLVLDGRFDEGIGFRLGLVPISLALCLC